MLGQIMALLSFIIIFVLQCTGWSCVPNFVVRIKALTQRWLDLSIIFPFIIFETCNMYFLYLFCCSFIYHHICSHTCRIQHRPVRCPFCPARGQLGRLPRRCFEGEIMKLSWFCWLTCILRAESRSRAPDDTLACTPLWTKKKNRPKKQTL